MTGGELKVIKILSTKNFVPGSLPKRFIMRLAAKPASYILTDRERVYLWAIAFSWRRQLPSDVVAQADEHSGGIGISNRKNALALPVANRKKDTVSSDGPIKE